MIYDMCISRRDCMYYDTCFSTSHLDEIILDEESMIPFRNRQTSHHL
jgi:hypothetical protein